MCFRANGQTLIREARLVPNCCSELLVSGPSHFHRSATGANIAPMPFG